ncbi:hypothetical protein TSMEX_008440 [Taenia solium]|eukprot:TsM_001077100 transcript=TsM_001077100 gene=TsM_001077100
MVCSAARISQSYSPGVVPPRPLARLKPTVNEAPPCQCQSDRQRTTQSATSTLPPSEVTPECRLLPKPVNSFNRLELR